MLLNSRGPILLKTDIDTPLEVIIRDDGSFEASENSPVTNRFRGTVSIRDGQVVYAQRNDSGTQIGRAHV